MEDVNKGFVLGIIITLIIVFVFVPQSMMDTYQQECICDELHPTRIVTEQLENGTHIVTAHFNCSPDLIESKVIRINETGLYAVTTKSGEVELERIYTPCAFSYTKPSYHDSDWSIEYRIPRNATIYYPNGSIYMTRNMTENMTYYEESLEWFNLTEF